MENQVPFDKPEKVNFAPGALLLREGEGGYFFYIIEEGRVEVFRDNPNGGEIVLGNIEAGQPLGEIALFTRSTRSASARALTKVEAVKVSWGAYRRMIDSLPPWAYSIISALILRLQAANSAIQKGEIIDWERTEVDKIQKRIATKISSADQNNNHDRSDAPKLGSTKPEPLKKNKPKVSSQRKNSAKSKTMSGKSLKLKQKSKPTKSKRPKSKPTKSKS